MIGLFKKIGKAFVVAFSIYSKIPMPRFNWESEDMQYQLCFFPWVGAVIGALEIGWYHLALVLEIGSVAFVGISLVLPILITGGFHIDGFMDTCDALHSYQDREKKLEILKDPHIGAFAVICVLAYFLLAMAGVAEMNRFEAIYICALSFFLSRTCSGISVITMKGAKNKGMLQTFSTTAAKKVVLSCLLIEGIICMVLMLMVDWKMGLSACLGTSGCYLYYYKKSYKEFGGITGDLAGFFVCIAELTTVLVMAVWCILS